MIQWEYNAYRYVIYKNIYQMGKYLPKTKRFDRTNNIKNSFIIMFIRVAPSCIFIYVKFNMFCMDSRYRHMLYNHVFSSLYEIPKLWEWCILLERALSFYLKVQQSSNILYSKRTCAKFDATEYFVQKIFFVVQAYDHIWWIKAKIL